MDPPKQQAESGDNSLLLNEFQQLVSTQLNSFERELQDDQQVVIDVVVN